MAIWIQSTYYNDFSEFGKALKHVREERELTQKYLADKTGLDRTYIASLEGGKRNPTLKTMIKIADALGLSLGDILYF